MKKLILTILMLFSSMSFAQGEPSKLTYDIGAATGTYNDKSYTELNLGLNWFLQDYLVWRNAFFHRMVTGADPASGLDTSLRMQYDSGRPDPIGFGAFAGGGYRITKKESGGPFAEAGLTLKVGGISIGGGVKAIFYPDPGKDANGDSLPKQDTTVFLILAGGGAF